MSTVSVEEKHLKDLLKEAILELVHERRDEFEEMFSEVIEDWALAKAIEEGESTETVSKAQVLQVLEAEA